MAQTTQDKVSIADTDQWMRRVELVISDSSGGSGDTLSLTPQDGPDLQIVFRVIKSTNQSPNILEARVFNLSPTTLQKALTYRRVSLSAGYWTGRYGKIFEGTIVQFRRGKETPVDTYLEILAGDGDLAYGFSAVNLQVEAGTTHKELIQQAIKQYTDQNESISQGTVDPGPYGDQKLLRSYSVLRQLHQFLREHGEAAGADWFVDDGKVNFLQRTAYRSGEAAVLTPKTGLVGMPQVTPQGIQAQCLLNPNLVLGGLVKIDTAVLSGVPFLPGTQNGQPLSQDQIDAYGQQHIATFQAPTIPAFTSPTGTYKILLLEHNGETRGNPYYSTMVCIALDGSGKMIVGNPDTALKRAAGAALQGVGGI